MNKSNNTNPFNIIVIVAALGYFVDIYDLILFGVVRIPSLESLRFTGDQIGIKGDMLISCQMFGMLVGGILWGILGDIRGRRSVLFGSIIMYSVANIANGFVTDIDTYAFLRFVAGVGLAGELGAGVTLVAETMSKEHRGWGTMIIATFGALGAVLASIVGNQFDWRIAYFVGGGLGLLLLLLRVGTYESGMFVTVRESGISKGAFFKLFTKKQNLFKYLACIAVGLPVWFTVGILILKSPEFARYLNIVDIGDKKNVEIAGKAIMWCYIGLSLGDLLSGYISQILRSRKKAVLLFLSLSLIFTLLYINSNNITLKYFYFLCFGLGFSAGYWALFVTISSEQFGTNIRATVTTTAPNFVRGAVVPMTASFAFLKLSGGMTTASLTVGMICLALAFVSIFYLKETFAKDLDYTE